MAKEDDRSFFFDFNDSSVMVIRSFISSNRSQQVPVVPPSSKKGHDTRPRAIKRYNSNQDSASPSSQVRADMRSGGEMTETETTEDCSSVCSDDTFARNSRHDGCDQRMLLLGTFADEDDDDDDLYDEDGFGIEDSDNDECSDCQELSPTRRIQSIDSADSVGSSDCEHSSVDLSSICSNDSFHATPREHIKNSSMQRCEEGPLQELLSKVQEESIELCFPETKEMPKDLFIQLSTMTSCEQFGDNDSFCEVSDDEDMNDSFFGSHGNWQSTSRMPRNMFNSPKPSESSNPKQRLGLDASIQYPIVQNCVSPSMYGHQKRSANSCFQYDSNLSTPVKAPQRQISWAHLRHLQEIATPCTPPTTRSTKAKVRFLDDVKVREFVSDIEGQSYDDDEEEEDAVYKSSTFSWDHLPDKVVQLRDGPNKKGGIPYFLSPHSRRKHQQRRRKVSKKTQVNRTMSVPPQQSSPRKKIASGTTVCRTSPIEERREVPNEVDYGDDYTAEYQNVLHMIKNAKVNIDQALLACEESKSYLAD